MCSSTVGLWKGNHSSHARELCPSVRLDIFSNHKAVVDVVVDELIPGVGAHIRDIDCVVKNVVRFPVSAYNLCKLRDGNTTEIGFDAGDARGTF